MAQRSAWRSWPLALLASALFGVGCPACGGGAAGALHLSVSSGPPGTAVAVAGNAGTGCTVNRPATFTFRPAGPASASPAAEIAVPTTSVGDWSATFIVPSYLGRPDGHGGAGQLVAPGRYELVAPSCVGHQSHSAAFTVTRGTTSAKAGDRYTAIAATLDGGGYWLVQADGAVHRFGDASWFGSATGTAGQTGAPIVGIARTYDEQGYWLVSSTGRVYPFGDARRYGSLRATPPAPVAGIAATPDGKGYWLVASDGHVYGFGDARVEGMPTAGLAPYDAIGTRLGGGYVVTSGIDAAVYAFPGGALVAGGPGNATSASFVGTAVTPSGNGTFQASADGNVLVTGDATFYGSVPANRQVVSAPVTAIATTPSGQGYWLLGTDGNVYNFGNAPFYGSALH